MLRKLFTRRVEINERKELVLLITPHVITTPAEGELKTRWRLQELSSNPKRDFAMSGIEAGEHPAEIVQPGE